MAKVIDVLIFFEHENRDLESALLLEHELKKRDLTVECVQVSWTAPIGPLFYKPKVIVANSIYDDKTMLQFYEYQGGLENGKFMLVNYHCEQIVTNAALGFSSTSGKAMETYHLSWGAYFRQMLLEAGVADDLIRITGSPRLDFFREEFRSFSESKENLAAKYGLDADSKWVMVLGNFSGAFLTDEQILDYIDRGNATCWEERELTQESLRTFLDWLDGAASHIRGEKVEVIYRPHPAEPFTEDCLRLEQKYPHFHVVRDNPVRDWILNSDLCLTWTSTSAVEAVMAKVPVYSLRPLDIPEAMQIPLLEYEPIIESKEELIDLLDRLVNSGDVDKNSEFANQISPYYYSFKERLAAEDTADLVVEMISEQKKALFESRFDLIYSSRKLINYYMKIVMKKLGVLKVLSRYELIPKERTTKKKMNAVRRKIDAVFG